MDLEIFECISEVLEEYEKEFLYRMLYGSQKIRNEKNSADPR